MNYQVLLYYKYTTTDDPEQFAQDHLASCKAHHLKGKILVSIEGINDIPSGTKEKTEQHTTHMHADEWPRDMMFKIDEAEERTFKGMYVRPRKEIVVLNLEEDIDPRHATGQYLSPVEFKRAPEDDDTVAIDVRNDYESDLGHLRGTIRPNIMHLRDLPGRIKKNEALFVDKKVVTYCTDGIRCEKFSGWLLKEGLEDVAQLHGDITAHGKDPETKGQYWDGEMYVFNDRISTDISQVEEAITNKDWFNGKPCRCYINYANPECNKQILVFGEDEAKYLGACSYDCAKYERNRYVQANNISGNEWQRRLANFGDLYQHA